MKDDDLAKRLNAWVTHGAPDEALDGSEQLRRSGAQEEVGSRTVLNSIGTAGTLSATNEAQSDYVSPRPIPGSRRLGSRVLVAATFVVVVLVGGIAAFGVNRSRAPELNASSPQASFPASPAATWKAGPCSGPTARGPVDEQSPEERAAAQEDTRLLDEEIDRTGFGFYSSPTQTGGWVCGWVPVGAGIDGAKAIIDAKGGQAVYDAPHADAGILGYGFMGLGFFTTEEVQAPTFDPAQLRVERYGCDFVTTESCRPSQTILGNGQAPEYGEG